MQPPSSSSGPIYPSSPLGSPPPPSAQPVASPAFNQQQQKISSPSSLGGSALYPSLPAATAVAAANPYPSPPAVGLYPAPTNFQPSTLSFDEPGDISQSGMNPASNQPTNQHHREAFNVDYDYVERREVQEEEEKKPLTWGGVFSNVVSFGKAAVTKTVQAGAMIITDPHAAAAKTADAIGTAANSVVDFSRHAIENPAETAKGVATGTVAVCSSVANSAIVGLTVDTVKSAAVATADVAVSVYHDPHAALDKTSAAGRAALDAGSAVVTSAKGYIDLAVTHATGSGNQVPTCAPPRPDPSAQRVKE
eukprot:gnl/Hemi2/20474_TR6799_c0_g1_i1.p1 gnl/Hemi2/20474_TR6799_c0_g1~~gnl/Hemi2/20474_TR6799_c0_g1_i1.p1  ORF type:complete len:307 (-),score=83.45 gnl/Hemi2/20474_TR6799_c0_g1_i1:130-1050(-)